MLLCTQNQIMPKATPAQTLGFRALEKGKDGQGLGFVYTLAAENARLGVMFSGFLTTPLSNLSETSCGHYIAPYLE